MTDTVQVFILGIPLAIFLVTLQIWSSFKSADKDYEAKVYFLIGSLVSFLILVIIAYAFGWMTKPAQVIFDILNIKIGLPSLLVWTILLLLFPKASKAIVSKITISGIRSNNYSTQKVKKIESAVKVRSKFKDSLKTSLSKWYTVSGSPQISSIRGKPNPPSLLLEEYPNDSRNSFVLVKNLFLKTGKIKCDIYLERQAVFNLVFRANSSASEFYMARIDSRSNGSNGFLIARDLKSWTYVVRPNTFVLNDKWHHIELNISDSKFELFIDNDKPIILKDSSFYYDGQIGMFNEVKRVFVNKFVVE